MTTDKEELLRKTLLLVMDSVDYTQGACNQTEMVGAVLPKILLDEVHKVLEQTKGADNV
jgi:hypothetical protein